MSRTLIPAVPSLAGLCAAGAVLAFPGRSAKRRLAALGGRCGAGPGDSSGSSSGAGPDGDGGRAGDRPGGRSGGRFTPGSAAAWWWPTVVVALVSAGLFRSPVLALVLPLAVWRAGRSWNRRVARLTAERRRAETLSLCLALRAELRGGREAREALRDAAWATGPEVSARLEGALASGTVVAVLRESSREPGREALGYLAACWHAAEGGAGLAHAVGRLATSLRAAEAQRRDVLAELAGVRTSARLLAALPVVGVILGTAMGAEPAGVLLGSPVGEACLVAGLGCVLGGAAWMDRIIRNAAVYA